MKQFLIGFLISILVQMSAFSIGYWFTVGKRLANREDSK